MAHTYSSMIFHVVWSTKARQPFISSEMKHRLYGYLRQVADDQNATIITINGMPDHVHLLLETKPNVALSNLICHLKTTSSKWIKRTLQGNDAFGWQDGYGVFSVGISTLQAVKRYIENQEEHHRQRSSEEEFISFLKAHQIDYDPRFVPS